MNITEEQRIRIANLRKKVESAQARGLELYWDDETDKVCERWLNYTKNFDVMTEIEKTAEKVILEFEKKATQKND